MDGLVVRQVFGGEMRQEGLDVGFVKWIGGKFEHLGKEHGQIKLISEENGQFDDTFDYKWGFRERFSHDEFAYGVEITVVADFLR